MVDEIYYKTNQMMLTTNNKEKKTSLSIIIPVYNMVKYVERCINSIRNQDFDDWEIILIDDGSNDGSSDICNVIEHNDARIKALHQNNSGVNVARLNGFKESTGDFLMFVDADDMLPEGTLSILMSEIKKGYDIVKGGHLIFDDKNRTYNNEPYRIYEKKFTSGEDFAIALYKGEIPPYLVAGIYRRDIIEESFFQRLINYNITIGEDCLMNMFVSRNVKQVKIVPQTVYLYYCNMDSVMNTKTMGREYANRVDMCISDFVASASEEVKRLFVLNQVKGIISRDFQKEIKFSMKDYRFVRTYISCSENWKRLRSSISPKFTIFLKNLPLYFAYSRLYAYCKWIKKGMHNKKVI